MAKKKLEWHGCQDPQGHRFEEGICQVKGCKFDLNFKKRTGPLFLEERVALVRESLDCDSFYFLDRMSKQYRGELRNYVVTLMDVLDGDRFGDARERLLAQRKEKYQPK